MSKVKFIKTVVHKFYCNDCCRYHQSNILCTVATNYNICINFIRCLPSQTVAVTQIKFLYFNVMVKSVSSSGHLVTALQFLLPSKFTPWVMGHILIHDTCQFHRMNKSDKAKEKKNKQARGLS